MRLGLAAVLVARVAGDSYDIHVKLYKDENCFEEQEMRMFTTDNCYANYFVNLTTGAVGFDLTIVSLSTPKMLAIATYTDNCLGTPIERRLINAGDSARSGQCEQFAGIYYGMFSIHFRSDCYHEADCSSIMTADQYFYDNYNCAGAPTSSFQFPLARLPEEHAKTFGRVVTVAQPGYESVGMRTTTGGFTGGVSGGPSQQQSISTQIAMSIGSDSGAFFDVPPDRNGGGRRRRRTSTCTRQCAECLRGRNGTMLFFTNSDSTQVHQFNYDLSPECDSEEYGYNWLAYTVGYCYRGIIYDRNNVEQKYSFMWDGPPAAVTSNAWCFSLLLAWMWRA